MVGLKKSGGWVCFFCIMFIEDVDVFKFWLVKLLELICDVDFLVLVNYVVVLVKKDKFEKELKVFCVD